MVSYTTLLYYTIYFIYIIAILVDWEQLGRNIDNNQESVFWGGFIILSVLLFLTVSAGLFYIKGVKIFNLNGIHLLLLLSVFTFLMIALFGFSYGSKIYTENSIKTKIKNFRILRHQYRRNSQDISAVLNIINELVPRENPKTLFEIWDNLSNNTDSINSIIKDIMYDECKNDKIFQYSLFWYFCLSENPFNNRLNKKEIKYILSVNNNKLLELVGDNYNGLNDRASLIFTLLSGEIIPNIELNSERYENVKKYPIKMIYNLAFNEYHILNDQLEEKNIYPPHIFISQNNPSFIEKFLTDIKIDDIEKLYEEFGVGYTNKLEFMSKDEKISFFQNEISLYKNVLTRPENLIQPPKLQNLNKEDILHILSFYSNIELEYAYEPRETWNSRSELLNIICDDILGIPKWSFTHQYCNNDDSMNIILGETRNSINKDDDEDPTLSYGVQKNYKCYQSSELEESFREYDGCFLFKNPDWNIKSDFDQEFPIESIKKLLKLLNDNKKYNLTKLKDKINLGLKLLASAKMKTIHLKKTYDTFNDQQKIIIDNYFSWMFMYSMWMRFWKGPGFPWPMTKININRKNERLKYHRSSIKERDEHVFIQENIRTYIIESYEKDNVLSKWINSLPTIYYDFETKEGTVASYPIKEILDKIALGNYCMGFGSDTILKTSYYYITSLLNNQEGNKFENFINRMIPSIMDLEYQVVSNQLLTLNNDISDKSKILNARLNAIQSPISLQPLFHPEDYQNNIHVEIL